MTMHRPLQDPAAPQALRATARHRCLPAADLAVTLAAVLIAALVLAPAALVAQSVGGVTALPLYDGSGTEAFLRVDLAKGDVYLFDRLRSDPPEARARFMPQNLYAQIGRPEGQPAMVGEILLGPVQPSGSSVRTALFVETSTGYVAYFDQPGKNASLGEITVALGRPFGPIASRDGNYALLMRRDGSGRTEGAYLYHASAGRALYLGELRELALDPPIATISALPELSGKVAAVPIQTYRERTLAYLIADSGNGDLYFLDLDADTASRLAVRKSALNLFTVLTAEAGPFPTPQRLVAVPLFDDDDRTRHAFFLDVTSGEMVLVENVAEEGVQPTLRKLPRKLYDLIGASPGSEPRSYAAVPRLDGDGETVGIWLLDSLTRGVLYLDNPASPDLATVQNVSLAAQ